MKRNNIIQVILIILSIIAIVMAIFLNIHNNKKILNESSKDENQIIEEPVISSLRMIMVGDALIHSSVYNDARRLANYDGYDFKPQITYIKEIVKDYDLAYYNQETILGGSNIGLSSYPRFNSPYEVGEAMVDAGFNLVSLATNHTMDKGREGVINSRNFWNQFANVTAIGSYSSNEEKTSIESKILEVNNIKYAMLNYTYGTNGISVPEDYLVNVWPTDTDNINNPNNDSQYQAYKETVKNDILAVRDNVDILIVAMHWGVEYTHTPTAYERDMAEFLASNGVDIIIGTHPHVIQPVEWIDNTIVFYSLGNFISAQYQNQDTCTYYKCMVGLMSSLTITKTEYQGKTTIKIDDINNDLTYTYYSSNWNNFKVIPFSNNDIKEYLPNYQNVYDKYAKIITPTDERIKTVPLGA